MLLPAVDLEVAVAEGPQGSLSFLYVLPLTPFKLPPFLNTDMTQQADTRQPGAMEVELPVLI